MSNAALIILLRLWCIDVFVFMDIYFSMASLGLGAHVCVCKYSQFSKETDTDHCAVTSPLKLCAESRGLFGEGDADLELEN